MVSNMSFPEVIVTVVVGCLFLYFFFSLSGGGGGVVKKKKQSVKEATEKEEDEASSISMPKGDLTVAELKKYDGSDPSLPVLVAAKGRVYDMTKGRDYYGRAPRLCFRVGALDKFSSRPIITNTQCIFDSMRYSLLAPALNAPAPVPATPPFFFFSFFWGRITSHRVQRRRRQGWLTATAAFAFPAPTFRCWWSVQLLRRHRLQPRSGQGEPGQEGSERELRGLVRQRE